MIGLINTARKILTDWLGEGGTPVLISHAQARANVCLECPHNYKGRWLYSVAVITAIKSQSKLRETLKIHVDGESDLHICDLCGCYLKLKVHVPFHHIHAHTSDEQFAKFPEWCWQKTENQQPR